MRFYTVPSSKQARKSVEWAIWLIGIFYLFTLVLGYGAGALVGPATIAAAPGGANSAAPLLAYELGGTVLLGIIAAVAFATILAVVAGLTITASASFAHDIYGQVIKRGEGGADAEVRVARIAAVVIGVVAIIGGIFANGQNIAFLVALAFAIAASANLPTILYSLFWKRFNTRGALWSIYGGLISSIVLIIFSPTVSGGKVTAGKAASMITDPSIDFHWFPLANPGLVSIPLGFFLGWLGTVTSKEHNEAKYVEMEVRSLTGAGAEKAGPAPLVGHDVYGAGRPGPSGPGRSPCQPERAAVRLLCVPKGGHHDTSSAPLPPPRTRLHRGGRRVPRPGRVARADDRRIRRRPRRTAASPGGR